MRALRVVIVALLVALPIAFGFTDLAHAAPADERINLFNWHHGKNVEGGELQPGETPMNPPLAAALLNFAVFGAIFLYFAGPPLRNFLSKRHHEIKDALSEASRLREEAQQKVEEYGSRIAAADAEIATLIAAIRSDAEAEKARILDQARTQAEAMKREAEARIEAEIARARIEVEREVVARAVDTAERILREKTTAADQNALIEGFIADLVPGESKGATTVDEDWT